MTLLYLGLAWILGIWWASLWLMPQELLIAGLLISGAIFILVRNQAPLRLASVAAIFLLLGQFRYQSALPSFDETTLAYYNDRDSVVWEGVVIDAPLRRERTVDLRVEAKRIQIEGEWREVKGLALVRVPLFAPYGYGDLLLLKGKLETPPEFPDFSWRDYLSQQGIHSLMRYPESTLLASEQGNPLYAVILSIKERAQTTIGKVFPEPEASLLSGILLGLESEIPRDLLAAFNRTNTRHIIAISGFNISILAGVLLGIGERLLGKRRRVYLALVGIGLYTVLVGAGPSVVRAAIMGGLYVLALSFGRQSHALISLVVAAGLMALLNPFVLWDIGFQLSFASTLGLVLYSPQITAWWQRVAARLFSPGIFSAVLSMLGEAILITFIAQLWVYPILATTFHQVSLISLLSNALIVPVQWGVMVIGGLATVLGMLFLPLGQVVGWFAWLFAAWTVGVAQTLGQFPEAALSVEGIDLFLAGIYYAILLLIPKAWPQATVPQVAVTPRLNLGRRAVLAGVLGAANVLTIIAILQIPDGRWHFYFLDVGQGDSILIQTPSGQRILVDGGPGFNSAVAEVGPRLPFWDREIDLVFFSHPHADHFLGLLNILERYEVGQVLYSQTFLDCDTSLCERVFEILAEKGIPHREAEAGMGVRTAEGIVLEVINPLARLLAGTGSDVNNNSLVIRLQVGSVSILLTADIESEAEKALLASDQDMGSLILKVGHHGSATSTTLPFLQGVSPRLAVISVGEDNPFGHPSSSTLERLSSIPVLRTDEHGTLELITDGERLWLLVER